MKRTAKKALGRRAACIALTAAMCATFAAGNVLAFADNKGAAAALPKSESVAFENANGTVNLDKIKLENMSSQVIKNESVNLNQVRSVIVSLEGDCLTEQTDDLCEYIKTPAGKRAALKIEEEQKQFLSDLSKQGISYYYCSSYNTVINAVVIEVNLENLKKIKSMEGVSTVSVSSTYARPKETSEGGTGAQINYSNIYANGIYDSSEQVEMGYDGRGMAVAILDTGIDYTHPAFLEEPVSPRYSKSDIDALLEEGSLNAENGTGAVYISSKIPFAYDYADKEADVYPSYSQHGTHVAGIVGGKADSYTDKDGYVAKDAEGNVLKFRGVAPESQLVICKVFTDDLDDKDLGGAETYDILHALEDCTRLGVDIINMSLGTSSGFASSALGLTEADSEGIWLNEVYANIRKQGITLMVAASNEFSSGYGSDFGTNLASNPDSGTVGSPSTFSGAMSVASVNGQSASYIYANGKDAIYYEESRNEDSDAYNFVNQMIGDPDHTDPADPEYKGEVKESETFKYVIVPGTGEATDYTGATKRELAAKDGKKVIAVIQRGHSSFKDKLETAKTNGADAAIVYNNVSGMIRMSLGDMQDPIPSISVSMDAGILLKNNGSTGTITLDRKYLAGPFMNEYSSWGATPDLQLKPDVTSHGGEITSAVAGGYDEMSGTSMACPNLAGFTALFKSYLNNDKRTLWHKDGNSETQDRIALTKLANNMMMSTATVVYDHEGLPYSPRKQGAGLATLANVFSTNAYLYTKDTEDTSDKDYMCEDGRPKAELGEDEKKKGEYEMTFFVKNFSDKDLSFKAKSLFFTETLGADGKSVAEKAYLFSGSKSEWTVDGVKTEENVAFTVAKNSVSEIKVKLTLGASDKKYLDANFKNGMYVEGFLQLISADESQGQCDLSFPFMGFYGDWEAAPMLDMDCFQKAEYDKDTSLNDRTRPQPCVWASQAYSYYYNEKYATPLGSFLYEQDEDKEHTSDYVYTDEEHIAISCFNDYYGDDEHDNYLTVNGIKALYAGLLRNAEIVTYTLTNVDTGEIIPDEKGNDVREIYRVNKAFANGGSPIPAQVLLELRTKELGLPANGKYELNFDFYFRYEDYVSGKGTSEKFKMSFYIDYEAPVLVDSRLRYQNMKDSNGKETQKIYLDLDVFDNTYPQCVILCYSETGERDETALRLATDYITPIVNPLKNTTNTVSIDITDIYEDYKGKLFVELDDYALNHNIYTIDLNHAQTSVCPSDFAITQGDSIEILKNTTAKLTLENAGNANLSNFKWTSSNDEIVKVKNGEIFGASKGTATVDVRGTDGKTARIAVTVKDSANVLDEPKIQFGTMLNSEKTPELASGMVEVNPAQKITLTVNCDPWYYPIEDLGGFVWTSSDESVATVDENGNVTVVYENSKRSASAMITATAKNARISTSVVLSVKLPYRVSNGTLIQYNGWGGEMVDEVTLGDANGDNYTLKNVRVLKIPSDKAIVKIGEEAFKDNNNVEVVVIPKNVTDIEERAFKDCTSLKAIAFISTSKTDTPADSSLSIIHRRAFQGCTSFEVADFSNCKVFTLDTAVFAGCENLKHVINMPIVGTMYSDVFSGCTSLESADISSLHVARRGIFEGCVSIKEIITSSDTALGEAMFSGCTALTSIKNKVTVEGVETLEDGLGCGEIPAMCFYRCSGLERIKLGADAVIGDRAFAACSALSEIDCGSHKIIKIGSEAFRSCVKLDVSALDISNTQMGSNAFAFVRGAGAVVSGSTLVVAERIVTDGTFAGIDKIGPYAFSDSWLEGCDSFDLSGITKLGEGAFYNLSGLKSVTLPEGITQIPDYAFYGTGLTSITIPSTVKKIGKGAFAMCTSLKEITFGGNEQEIGDNAFASVAITQLSLPSSVTAVGREAFTSCGALTEVTLPSVRSMGEGVFSMCYSIESAEFGDGATTLGTYTFFTPDLTDMTGSGSLKNVKIGSSIEKIDEGAFAYCGALESIDLNNATRIESNAFFNCLSLKNVTGLENTVSLVVTERVLNDKFIEETREVVYPAVGAYAFAYCVSLESVSFIKTDLIDHDAFFFCSSLESISFGEKIEQIGDNAFAETAIRAVQIPASCSYIGTSAFSGAIRLNAINVSADNKNYFSDDGVLYRYITQTTYELCQYPLGRAAQRKEGISTYKALDSEDTEGAGTTVAIGAFAFYGVPSDKITKIVLPYSVKTIGDGAFLACGATAYEFYSIQAPTLLEGLLERNREEANEFSANALFNNNFGYVKQVASRRPGGEPQSASTLTISYPSNGTGYNNFIYSAYFGSKVVMDEMPEDNSRTLKAMLDGLMGADEVSAWAAGKSNEEIEQFSETLKTAHILYNSLSSDYQREFVTAENIEKLFAVEKAMKPIKASAGIVVKMGLVAVDLEGSSHRTEYKEGEWFSLEGLKLVVSYDDYTTEIIDASGNFELMYERELWESDSAVSLRGKGAYDGKTVTVKITVTGEEETPNENENPSDKPNEKPDDVNPDKEKDKLPVGAIIGICAGGAVLIAVAVLLVIFIKRRAGGKEPEGGRTEEYGEPEEGEASEETATEAFEEEAPAEEAVTEENGASVEENTQDNNTDEQDEEGKTDD